MQKTSRSTVIISQVEEEGLKTPTKSRKAAQVSVVVTPERRRRGQEIQELKKAVEESVNIVTPSEKSKSRALTPNRTIDVVEPTSLKKEFQQESTDKCGVKASSLLIPKGVEKCYKIVRKATGALGGNGHTGWKCSQYDY